MNQILSCNLHQGRGDPEAIRKFNAFVSEIQPEMVCLQEVTEAVVLQLPFLLEYSVAASQPRATSQFFNLTATRGVWVDSTLTLPYSGRALVTWNREYQVVNLHLKANSGSYNPFPREDKPGETVTAVKTEEEDDSCQIRTEQLQSILEQLQPGKKTVLIGDFNFAKFHDEEPPEMTRMTMLPLVPTYFYKTSYGRWIWRALDRCYVSDSEDWTLVRIGCPGLSDHQGLLVMRKPWWGSYRFNLGFACTCRPKGCFRAGEKETFGEFWDFWIWELERDNAIVPEGFEISEDVREFPFDILLVPPGVEARKSFTPSGKLRWLAGFRFDKDPEKRVLRATKIHAWDPKEIFLPPARWEQSELDSFGLF